MQNASKTMSTKLPEAFQDLDYLVDEWAIEDGHERYLKRVNTTMDEMKAFYDVLFPRAAEAIEHINQFDYPLALPAETENLRNLVYSLITVSLAVELWRQPRVRNSANIILTRLC